MPGTRDAVSVALHRRPAKVQPAKALSSGEAAECEHHSAGREKSNTIPTRNVSWEPSSWKLMGAMCGEAGRVLPPRSFYSSGVEASQTLLRSGIQTSLSLGHRIASAPARSVLLPQPQQAWRQGHCRGTRHRHPDPLLRGLQGASRTLAGYCPAQR